MPKKADPETLNQDFTFATDRELDEKIAAFRKDDEAATGRRLAMHARRSLGAGKVRVTFRVVAAAPKRR